MLESYYYHGLLRKYVIYFGNLFNDITIQRDGVDGSVMQDFAVPIAYGPKAKFIARLEQDYDPNKREIALTLPRLSFEITNFTYDAGRKLPTLNKIRSPNTSYNNRISSVYTPVPYNITFNLLIYAKSAEDGMKILEQIIPYFTPEWTSTLNLIPELGMKVDIPVVLTGTDMSDRYEGSFSEGQRRYIIHTLTFTMKGYFFGPVSSGGIIKRAIANIYDSTLNRSSNLTINSYITNFRVNDKVYQFNGTSRVASGTVSMANSSHLTLSNVLGRFNTQYNILSETSQAIGQVLTVSSAEIPTEVITVRPTLTANGNPTNDVSDSIDLDMIQSTDNYGINVSISEP